MLKCNPHYVQMQYEKPICANCYLNFANKSSLKRHLKTAHPEKLQINSIPLTNHVFFCAKCNKRFSRRDSLVRHHHQCHPDRVQILFECDHCRKKFNRKINLVRHLRTHYRSRDVRSTSIQCIECRSYFPSKNVLNQHYKLDHRIQFRYENIRFECFKKFVEWKNNLEQEMICQFRVRRRRQNKTETKMHYVCHRSGIYNGNDADRKRRLKLIGSKRIGGHCPAEIIVSCDHIDHSCAVIFQNVHIGHEIGNNSELKYMHLSKEEKTKLVTKLNPDVTTKIVKRRKLLDINAKVARRDTVSAGICSVSQKIKTDNDELNLQFFIMQNSESILYFKDKLKDDKKYGLLENTDYMIVIMDTVQEESLRRYGHKVVAIDSTRGTNPQEYLLHTLLVVNADFEGFPVAFAVTNRNDHNGIRVFFKCVKDRVGIIKTKTLMSDIQLIYFNCWSDIMQPPERHLYCTCHVYDRWKKNLKKISCFRKKKEIKERLYSLATEMDVTLFKEGLQSFLLNFDCDTKDFVEYFRTYYAAYCEKWTYCYRLPVEMSMNMYLERFHNIFKKNAVKGKKIKTITSCLRYLIEYLRIKEKDYLCKEINGKISSKLNFPLRT